MVSKFAEVSAVYTSTGDGVDDAADRRPDLSDVPF
jgi:hypothetical protein